MTPAIGTLLQALLSTLALRLATVLVAASIALATGSGVAGALLGAALLGAYSLGHDLRAERRERLEGLAGAPLDPRLSRRLLRLAARVGVPAPPVYLVASPGMSASLCGLRRGDQAILIGRELRAVLHGRALEAMLAHELGHAVYRDVFGGIVTRALFGLASGALLGFLPALSPLGLVIALLLAPLLAPLKGWVQLRAARLIERRADRFAARLVGTEALARALRQTHRHERAQLALSAAIERATRYNLPLRRIDRASALLLNAASATRHLIAAERRLTRDLPAEARAEIRAIRRQDPWGGGEGAVYGSIQERLGRIRAF